MDIHRGGMCMRSVGGSTMPAYSCEAGMVVIRGLVPAGFDELTAMMAAPSKRSDSHDADLKGRLRVREDEPANH